MSTSVGTVDTMKQYAIKAKDAAFDGGTKTLQVIKSGGSSALGAIGQGCKYVGKFLSDIASKIASYVQVFFNNLPHYFSICKQWSIDGLTFIKNNKQAVAVGFGIGAIVTLVTSYLAKCFFSDEQ